MLLRTLERGDISTLAAAPPGAVSPAARISAAADPGRDHGRANVRGEELHATALDDLGAEPNRSQRVAGESNATQRPLNKPVVATRAGWMESSRDAPQAALGKPFGISLHLSTTAQMVGALLRRTGDASASAMIRPTTPLVGTPPNSPDQLAQSLKTSVAHSGLFYESHLASWAQQRYPIAELAYEPQAAWVTPVLDTGPTPAPMPSPSQHWAPAAAYGVLPEAAWPLIGQQFDALERQSFAWQGELWPGQEGTFAISQDGSPADAADNDVAGTWRVRLALSLPRLGHIAVHLALNGDKLELHLAPGELASAQRMRETRPELIAELRRRTFEVGRVRIEHDDIG